MTKAVASVFLFCLRFAVVTGLFLIADLPVFAAFSQMRGIALSEQILWERFFFISLILTPLVYFLSVLRGHMYGRKQSAAEKGASVIVCLTAAFAYAFVISGYLRPDSLPFCLMTEDLTSVIDNWPFFQSTGLFYSRETVKTASLLFPVETFSQTAFRIGTFSHIFQFFYVVSLFFLMTTVVLFFSRSRWPLFNVSVSLLVLYILLLCHGLWMRAFICGRFSLLVFSSGLVAADFLSAFALLILMWRRSRDTVF